ncbi:BIG1-domain-containing protein [Trichodelitschia bisporula]|uniref:Protein BIG1 n=1 Tax=Trichodelitschia bisporula TaxID=703511 RepID=A0A6G1IBX8_9PEZI|nr:BIG1-domain-containing protein [Trichodelitschia bisporula]
MARKMLCALALAASGTAAFSGTSPFLMFSSSQLGKHEWGHAQLATSASVNSLVSQSLSTCPSDTYILVSQPGVSAADFENRRVLSYLGQVFNHSDSETSPRVVVPEVAGLVDVQAISRQLQEKCKAEVLKADASTGTIPNQNTFPRLVIVDLPLLPQQSHERAAKLADHDSFLKAVVTSLGGDKYAVLFTTTPVVESDAPSSQYPLQPAYEMDDPYAAVMHTDLKRNVPVHADDGKLGSNLPLFHTYQFLSPAIFMGLLVTLLLLLILYVGISAVSSLQVSYFAFSKEMGPSGQKKQQ